MSSVNLLATLLREIGDAGYTLEKAIGDDRVIKARVTATPSELGQAVTETGLLHGKLHLLFAHCRRAER